MPRPSVSEGNTLTKIFRSISAVSPLAIWALLTRGPGAARKVIGEAAAAAFPKKNPYKVDMWDMVRGFASDSTARLSLGDWTDGATAPLERVMLALLLHHFKPQSTWKQVPSGIDFAFIDASHSYEAVKNDTEKVWPKLSPNAVVAWHDYTEVVTPERGVGKYIRERMQTETDLFLCEGTDMAFRIPKPALEAAARRVPEWYVDGSFPRKRPHGIEAWLR